MSTEQLEYICQQCRKRTISRADEDVVCPKCDIPMQPREIKSKAAAAAANSPDESSVGGVTIKKTRSSTKAKSKAKAKTRTTKASKAAAVAAAAAPESQASLVGQFRCACCGHTRVIQPGESRPDVLRCPTCFVKLEKVK